MQSTPTGPASLHELDIDGEHVDLTIRLSWAQSRFVEQERTRLEDTYGICLSASDVIRVLLDAHRLRILAIATDTDESLAWMYCYLRGEFHGELSGRIQPTADHVRDDGVDQATITK